MSNQLNVKEMLIRVEETIENNLKKVPAMPNNVKEWLVSILPWLLILLVIISIPAVLTALGIGSLIIPYGSIFSTQIRTLGFISFVVGVIQVILELISIPGLFRKELASWRYLFIANILGIFMAILTLYSFGIVVGILITYILFQIRKFYK